MEQVQLNIGKWTVKKFMSLFFQMNKLRNIKAKYSKCMNS